MNLKPKIHDYRMKLLAPVMSELDSLYKNMVFLVDNTVDIGQVKSKPSIKRKQIEIYELLEGIDRFMSEQDFDYFLFFGTLLGCVRHGGFVPWDDDIDIGMLQEDFEKLLEKEPLLKEYGLILSSPYSPRKHFPKGGWHKLYFDENGKNISIFVFDLIECENIPKFQEQRLANQQKAVAIRDKFKLEKLNFDKCQKQLSELKENHLGTVTRRTKESATARTYMAKSVMSSSEYTLVPFQTVFPLKKAPFIVKENQAKTGYPIPNTPEAFFENFYGKNYMHFPKDIFPRH